MNNICDVKILIGVTNMCPPKAHEKTRINTNQHLSKSPYLGDSKGTIGCIIEIHQLSGIAAKSGNLPRESLWENPAELIPCKPLIILNL